MHYFIHVHTGKNKRTSANVGREREIRDLGSKYTSFRSRIRTSGKTPAHPRHLRRQLLLFLLLLLLLLLLLILENV